MPYFVYQAYDPRTRKIIKESGNFYDLSQLFYFLKRQGLILLKFKTRTFSFYLTFFSKVTRPELAEFCRNLAFLIKGGVPFQQALLDIHRSIENQSLRRAIRDIIQYVNEGSSFSEALKKHSKTFGPIIQALVSLGEETGQLDKTLEDAADHLMRVHEIVINTRRALLYPSFVLFSMTAALVFWLFYVLPKILRLFKELNIVLPLPTRILMILVKFLSSYWPIILFIIFFLVVFLVLSLRFSKSRFFLEKISLKLPFIRLIYRHSIMAFFFEYLSLLLQAGIEVIRSTQILEDSINSIFTKKLIQDLRKYIIDGFSFSKACEMVGFFNALEQRMIYVGEETGRLVEQLRYLADYYYRSLGNLVATMSKIVEPVLIIIAGFLFLLIALALLGPIYDLMSNLGSF